MVTAPHALATQAGLEMLRRGGNAADAAVTVAAALCVLYPHMTGIGGDAFFLYYDAASRRVHAYNGSGRSAKLATLRSYLKAGHRAIPATGASAALTVPGAVDAWFALLERFGSLPVSQLLQPAISYAAEGAPAAASFVRSVERLQDVRAADDAARDLFVRRGPSRVGAIFANRRLADALSEIVRGGRNWFYRGEGARAICAHAERLGSPLRMADFEEHCGSYVQPLAARFFGFESVTTPPNSQGLTLLVAQQTYEAFARRHQPAPESPAAMHAAVESMKRAIADRDAVVGDADHSGDWEAVLGQEHAQNSAAAIDPYEARRDAAAAAAGDTTYFACVDRQGNAVSFIQSLFHHFGCGVVVPELGSALQNRGMAFELTDGELRSLAPGRRAYHTLMPCMLLRDGTPALVYGSMGGDAQPQIGLQVSTRIAVDGRNPQHAIELPRWRWSRDDPGGAPRLFVESRMNHACIAGLAARGHDVVVLGEFEESMGHAGAIAIDRSEGVLSGASDPRSDGAAAGL
jgi:gamma-glutamyltranspeptidase